MTVIVPMVTTMEGQRMFATDHGRLGRAPANIRSGDLICIFSFAKTAHILRCSSDRSQTTYTLVGETYVHGMMNGEMESLIVEEQDIVLV